MVEQASMELNANYVIDGLNVCKWQRLSTSLTILLTLILELSKRGATFTCIFDAVTPHRLTKDDLPVYQKLLGAFSEHFIEVTGGIEADDIILSLAHSSNSCVISNDRFRKNKYTDRYPWLDADAPRLIKGCIVRGNLIVSALDINTPINSDPTALVGEIQQTLKVPSVRREAEGRQNRRRGVGRHEGFIQPTTSENLRAVTASDLARRERLLQEIKEFRAQDMRRRKAKKIV